MFNHHFFPIILGICLLISTSASDTKEETKQKEIDSKFIIRWNEKFDNLNERMEHMEANQLTGSSAIENNIAKLMDMVQQVFKKMEDNSKKLENNSKKLEKNCIKIEKIEDLMEKRIGEKLKNSADDVISEFRSKCRSMCEVKGHSVANQSKAEVEHLLDQLESCLIEDNQKAVNVCSPNPCNGGQCKANATGSGFSCSNCPNSTYGNNCEKSECERAKHCLGYNNTAYFVFEAYLNWEEANRKCVAKGMTLAKPKDQESTEFLVSQLRAIYVDDVIKKNDIFFWMGLKYDAGGHQWRWTDGSPLGEYTGGFHGFKRYHDHCGYFYLYGGNQMWYPDSCNYHCYPVCEKAC